MITKNANLTIKEGEPLEHTLFVKPVELRSVAFHVVDADTGAKLSHALVSTREVAGVTDQGGEIELQLPSHAVNSAFIVSHQDYYPKTATVSPRSQNQIQIELSPLPILSGRITTVEKRKEGEVQLKRLQAIATSDAGKKKKVTVDAEGAFQLKLLPGEYDLIIRGKGDTGGYMTLSKSRINVKKEGSSCSVRVPVVGMVSVKVISALPPKESQPRVLMLLDANSRRVWATELTPDKRDAAVLSPIGEYSVVVIAKDERKAKLFGSLLVTRPPYQQKTLVVNRWDKMCAGSPENGFSPLFF